MIEDLKNKVVLITGSSTGIGAAAAKAFGANGARVAVHYNKSKNEAEKVAAEIERSGGKAFLVAGDVSGSKVCKDLVNKTVAHFGRIDVLINNAGGVHQRRAFRPGNQSQRALGDDVYQCRRRADEETRRRRCDH